MRTIRPNSFALVLTEFAAASSTLHRCHRPTVVTESAKTIRPEDSELTFVDVPGIH
jgi:hypothetical protein